jgi:hypothetical protein
MGIQVTWDDADETILLVTSEGEWTWDDHRASVDEAFDLIRSRAYPIGVIINRDHDSQVPDGGNPMAYYRRLLKMIPANAALFVLVSANPFARSVASIVVRLSRDAGDQVVFVSSLDEARQRCQKALKTRQQTV